jgi:uncharacterized membrane protein YfcA
MPDSFFWSNLGTGDWLILIISGLLIGISKAGINGASLLMVPAMAYAFGGKGSTGIVLPMLIIADIFAVKYYHRHANWSHICRVMPWAILGILCALVVGQYVSDIIFKKIMAICIFFGIVIMIGHDFRKENLPILNHWWFSALLGVAGGFATMIGNAAGPIMSIYLLAMRLPKYDFIGTAAWFFFIVNLIKFPLHVFFWKTITLKTISLDLLLIPAIILGVFLGIMIVKVIPEKAYRLLVVITIIVSAVVLF